MIAAKGTAVPLCKAPTAEAAMAAMVNCMLPSKAEALPALARWSAMAQAVAFGSRQPRQDTQQNSGISNGQSDSGCAAATANNASALPKKNHTQRRTQNSGPRQRTSRSEEQTSELQSLMRISYAV